MAMTGPVPMKPSMSGSALEGGVDGGLLLGLVGIETDELADDLTLERLGEAVAALFERDVRLFLTTAQDLRRTGVVEALTGALPAMNSV